jgi:hypothetical protein
MRTPVEHLSHKWQKGAASPNPSGRPKSAFKENFDQLAAKKKMFEEATQVLSERWADIVHSMCDCAEGGNVQAAAFVASYVLGKPTETVKHDIGDELRKSIHISIIKEESDL